ncbi:MAG: hypothetical protein [Caudoviricetes sp.]|nr:MAG: hypothetical protein [Caudoviricetes sp.]
MKPKPNTFYSIDGAVFILYVDHYLQVGFGKNKAEAASSAGRHNHWIRRDGMLSGACTPIRQTPLENK